jgi:hypothetical protein
MYPMRGFTRSGSAHVNAADDRCSGRGLQQAAQHADRRRLSGAIASEEAEDFAGTNLERDVIDGHEAAEASAQMSRFDCQCRGRKAPAYR